MNIIFGTLMTAAMIPLMAVLNRVRGSDLKAGWLELDDVATFAAGLVPCLLLFFFSPMFVLWPLSWKLLLCLLPLGGYIMGESWGWGEWIGGIIDHGANPQLENKQGFENGIHWAANQVFDEETNYLNYCRFALLLRGIWWWLPALLPLLIFGAMGGWFLGTIKFIAGMAAIGAGFPLSVEVSRWWNLRKEKYDGNVVWAEAETIYGGLHGLIISLTLLI